MSEKRKPRTNPRAGSSDHELWDVDLDWYFNDFESLCGLQSIGTSGAGENELTPMTETEKLARQQQVKNGFLLTMLGHAKPDLRSVSSEAADRHAFTAMAHGVFRKGRKIWKRLTRLPYNVQQLLRRAYEERIPEAGANWGRQLLTDEQVLWLHHEYHGKPNAGPYPASVPLMLPPPPSAPWKNPQAVPRHLFATLERRDDDEDFEKNDDVVPDVVEVFERGLAVLDMMGDDE